MRRDLSPVWKFFRTPKGLLIIILAIFIAIAAPHEGIRAVAPGMLGAVLGAGLVDALILREFPSGAVLTAMITAMILRPQEPWYVTTAVSIAAVLSKYVIRSRSSNVFNPAALAIIASFYIFHTSQNWWGALPEVPAAAQLSLVAGGVFIASRVNKMPLVLVFLGTYFLLFTVTAYAGNPRWVSEVFRTPDVQAALYFAFIILTDPPTSPTRYRDQVVFGVIVAVASYAVFEWLGVVYYLLAGILVGNLWEAWRRVHARSGYRFPGGVGFFLREITPWTRAARTRIS